ncbi:transcription initiation factor TFIID subunit [Striga asiatica]|uniref:Transcription initiation factor TFIID subunit n=1 Tax=Striga asiatica TaxID=4170 RepID=A0A5A7PP38_STRAF|nr:transcription initiation factor TFIID subunit [Striga asiatica]
MNGQSSHQQSKDGRHDDDATLTEFLSSLMDYTPTIPDELVEHYLAKSGFQCPDIRLGNHTTSLNATEFPARGAMVAWPETRLVAVATQKFIADVATDALQHKIMTKNQQKFNPIVSSAKSSPTFIRGRNFSDNNRRCKKH